MLRSNLLKLGFLCYPVPSLAVLLKVSVTEQSTVKVVVWYSQLLLRQTHSGPALTVRLREVSALEGDEVNDWRTVGTPRVRFREISQFQQKWRQQPCPYCEGACFAADKPAISQSCAVAKSDKFWRTTGQSNFAYKRLAATKASKVWFSWSSILSSDPPNFVTFGYCAWLKLAH